jgi:hypothetical protein
MRALRRLSREDDVFELLKSYVHFVYDQTRPYSLSRGYKSNNHVAGKFFGHGTRVRIRSSLADQLLSY